MLLIFYNILLIFNFTNIKYDNLGENPIFETTAKTSVLGRWGVTPDLQYGKKIKKFKLKFFSLKTSTFPFLFDKTTR